MPNRREFLAVSIASPALSIAADVRREGSQHLSSSGTGCVRSSAVIVETTSPLALAFRAEAVKWGLPVHGINDDITDLWYNNLDRLWTTAPATLAGITLSTSLFCLETFARDYGMRVWFRATHKTRPDGSIEHVLSGDEHLVEQAAALSGEWPGAFARFAAAVPLGQPGKFHQHIAEVVTSPQEEPGPMVSWIIAPRQRIQSGPTS